ncbi:MAG: hypothetical protein LBL42_03500 [Tannerella sp.]|nr:hypothetical protein [Tannerella sp.]
MTDFHPFRKAYRFGGSDATVKPSTKFALGRPPSGSNARIGYSHGGKSLTVTPPPFSPSGGEYAWVFKLAGVIQ